MNSFITKFYFSALVLFFCILRLITLDLQPLSLDELTTVNLISTNKGLPYVLDWIRLNDTQLPLFYIIEYFVYHFIGKSVFILRLPALIFILLGVYFSYLFVRKNDNKEKSYFVTLFLLSSFILTFHSQEIRPYGLLFLLSTLSFILSNSKKKKGQFYITLFLLSITHYFGLALALIHLLIKVIPNKNKISFIKALIILLPCLVLTYLFGKDFYIDFFVIHPFRDHLSILSVASTAVYFIGGKFLALLLVLIIVSEFVQNKYIIKRSAFYLPCLLLISLVLVKSLLTTPILEARYLIGLMFPFTYLLSQYTKTRYSIILIICLALYNTYIAEKILKTPYRLETKQSAKYINTKHQEVDFVTSCDINLKYYITNFKDCYHKTCDLPDNVIYVSMNNNAYECPTYKSLVRTHKSINQQDFKGLQVHFYKKK